MKNAIIEFSKWLLICDLFKDYLYVVFRASYNVVPITNLLYCPFSFWFCLILVSQRQYKVLKDEYHGKGERSVRDTAKVKIK